MKILILNDYASQEALGGAEVVIKNIMRKSRHKFTIKTGLDVVFNYVNYEDYDIIHLHNIFSYANYFNTSLNYIITIHGHILECPSQSGLCDAISLNCFKCEGVKYFINKFRKFKNTLKIVRNAKYRIVHSKYMTERYAKWDVKYMPIPLEIDEIKPNWNWEDRDDYILYSARLGIEKNPLAFVKLVKHLKIRGIMAMNSVRWWDYKTFMKSIKHTNIELVLEPTFKELLELYRNAKLVVHPFTYAEPFGIANANAILTLTPVISYPFGNLKNVSSITAYPFEDLKLVVKKALENVNFYKFLIRRTKMKRNVLMNKVRYANEKWDKFYEEVARENA
ncbi:MAG: glycosyltransferase [Candidatus Odinarchaeia archaeon]